MDLANLMYGVLATPPLYMYRRLENTTSSFKAFFSVSAELYFKFIVLPSFYSGIISFFFSIESYSIS